MTDHDGRGKYLAVPLARLQGNDVTLVSDVTCTHVDDTLVITNDFQTVDSSRFPEISYYQDGETIADGTLPRRHRPRRTSPAVDRKMQRNYLILAILSVFFCPLCGVIAVCYSLNSRQSYAEGDYEAGRAEAQCAKVFSLAAILTMLTALSVAGLLTATVVLVFPTHF